MQSDYAEKLARRIAGANASPTLVRCCKENVESTLRAIEALASGGGPKLVEREPTSDMILFGTKTGGKHWRAMFDAAPAIPEGCTR